jgi:hypothetical protein
VTEYTASVEINNVAPTIDGLTALIDPVDIDNQPVSGGAATQTYEYIVIHDPEGGFVTGGGWIISPAGAYVADPSLTGKVNFGFVSKKGADTPTGQTEFQFKAGDLNFHSSSYDWLVVAGQDRAKYKGTGTINGSGNYGFMLTAKDSSPDTFRIRSGTRMPGTGSSTTTRWAPATTPTTGRSLAAATSRYTKSSRSDR